MPLTAIYLDDDLRAGANAAGRNYWHAYTRELFSQMGLPNALVPRSHLKAAALAPYRVLILPDLESHYLQPGEKQALQEWVEAGGLLVGFATGGLHTLFGVKLKETLPQPQDAFTPVAAVHGEGQLLAPILAPVKLIEQSDGQALGRLADLFGRDLRRPAITLRQVGRGRALYFCFDVAHAVWAMHHGRPVQDDYDGDGRLTLRDAVAVRPFAASPYADRLVGLLRDAIARHGLAFVHTLPPTAGGRVPQPATAIPLAGCVTLDVGAGPYRRRDVEQALERQGPTPVCAAFAGAAWCGWTEPAQWLADAGALADGTRAVLYPQFGTSYPFRLYRDWHFDNDPTRCLALPAGLPGFAEAAELARWWQARSNVSLEQTPGGVTVACDWESGCVVRLAWEGEAMKCGEVREEDGLRWLYVPVPRGQHEITLV